MSENNHEELFKTTLMGGFDKDDVMTKVQNLKDQRRPLTRNWSEDRGKRAGNREAEPQDPRA